MLGHKKETIWRNNWKEKVKLKVSNGIVKMKQLISWNGIFQAIIPR